MPKYCEMLGHQAVSLFLSNGLGVGENLLSCILSIFYCFYKAGSISK